LFIYNATIHNGNGKAWDKGFIRIENGKISSIGEQNAAGAMPDPSWFDVLDAGGKHVYPGFMSLNTPLGLNEIDAVRATNDERETGKENPNVQAISAYNTDSDLIPTIRLNGVLMAQITPGGRGIAGLSSVVQLDAWNWEDAVLKKADGMHLHWPSRYAVKGWWAEPGTIERNKEYQKEREDLERTFTEARMYHSSATKQVNVKLQSFAGLYNGSTKLFIHAEFAADIISALEFARQQNLNNVVLFTGSQVLDVIDLVKDRNIPVVLSRLHELPSKPDDPVHLTVEVPAKLVTAGIQVALDYSGSMEIMGSRNLAFLAGSATRYGLSKEQALQLITLNPAAIVGLDKTCGSLEAGKDATLFISEGDALDMSTQKLTHAWIQGRPMALESKQTVLFSKFSKMLDEGR
jgi:imidazolonepropionase-like amidohydrolase